MKILGLEHIQILVTVGQEALARSYEGELLGLTEVDKPISLAGRGGLWF